MIFTAAHGNRNVHSARAHGEHTDAAACGCVAVGADKGLAGNSEPLKMNLMANSVARTGIINAVLFCDRTDKAVVVGIFKTGLQGVVVNISDRALGFYSRDSHGLKFKVCHGSGCVLCEGLVDFKTYIAADGHFAADKVSRYDFFGNIFSHAVQSFR